MKTYHSSQKSRSSFANSDRLSVPKDGMAGLKENFKSDLLAGFLVFLLALPLSLGIAQAGEFPPAMGILTAMIGGMFVSFLAGSKITVKGPAAGLTTIYAGCVTALGAGLEGWHLTLGVCVVASILQIILGLLKAGSLSNFFPHAVVHGMLAAIGLIIISKQVHILLGIDLITLAGMKPLALYAQIPSSIVHANNPIALIGVISLIVLFGMPRLDINLIKKIPAPMIVLLIAIPTAAILDFQATQPEYILIKIGNFWESIGYNPDFSAIGTITFWKFVAMFLIIGSLESSITVKASDKMDPWKRHSDFNKDLVAIGVGNTLTGFLGGPPMISEVVRSSANISFGARTRWANFFHGFFLFIAMLLLIPIIELIPNTALAAVLIFVGYRLASPQEFVNAYKTGKEQFLIFCTTITFILATDLLVGMLAGIIMKLLIHLINGARFSSLFRACYQLREEEGEYNLTVLDQAIFSNLMSFKKLFKKFKSGKKIIIDFSQARLIDHTFMEFLEHFQAESHENNNIVTVNGLERFQKFSDHPLSGRKIKK